MQRLDPAARRGGRSAVSARPAGYATVTMTRAGLGIAALAALAVSGCEADVGGPDEVRATISVALGDNQRGNVNFRLAEPLMVRVRTAGGLGVEDVEVTWSIISGEGLLSDPISDAPSASVLRTLTGATGLSGVFLRPTLAGTTRVAATAAGLQGSPVTFTAEAAEAIPPDWPPVPASSLVYDRTSDEFSTGPNYERYVLHEDGTFALQSFTGAGGFSELDGTYAREGTLVTFHFNLNSPQWQATGTVSGECLMVEYNWMAADEFANGEFCRPSETR